MWRLIGGSLLEQGGGEIQPGIGSGMTTAGELACQLAVPAAQVQQVIGWTDLIEHAQHTRLQAQAGGGKWNGKGLVELPVEVEQV